MVGVAVMFGDPHMLRRERVLVVAAVLVAYKSSSECWYCGRGGLGDPAVRT